MFLAGSSSYFYQKMLFLITQYLVFSVLKSILVYYYPFPVKCPTICLLKIKPINKILKNGFKINFLDIIIMIMFLMLTKNVAKHLKKVFYLLLATSNTSNNKVIILHYYQILAMIVKQMMMIPYSFLNLVLCFIVIVIVIIMRIIVSIMVRIIVNIIVIAVRIAEQWYY